MEVKSGEGTVVVADRNRYSDECCNNRDKSPVGVLSVELQQVVVLVLQQFLYGTKSMTQKLISKKQNLLFRKRKRVFTKISQMLPVELLLKLQEYLDKQRVQVKKYLIIALLLNVAFVILVIRLMLISGILVIK